MNRRRRSLALIAGLVLSLVGCASPAAPNWTYAPPAAGASATANAVDAGMPMPGMSGAPVADGAIAAGGEIAIDAFDLGFTPATVAVAAAGSYPVTFHNTGAALHDVTFADGTKLTADPGATVKGTVNVPAAGLAFLCSIPGHGPAGILFD